MLNPIHFRQLDILWGAHTLDRFARHNSFQLPRFCSPIDGGALRPKLFHALTVSWGGETIGWSPPGVPYSQGYQSHETG